MRSLELEPDPSTLPADPAAFAVQARMVIGPTDAAGDESFDVTVCSPEWLAKACQKSGGIYDARHHVVVSFETFDQAALRAWLAQRVQTVEAPTWAEIGERLARLGHWEFEDYRG